jgi:hypothetical protein
MDKYTSFSKRIKNIHGDVYDYSMIDMNKSSKEKQSIICPIHGVFYKTFGEHMCNKQGCPSCTKNKIKNKKHKYIKDMLNICSVYFDNKYNYSLIDIDKSVKEKQPLLCKKHGIFYITLDAHFNKKSGCPKCSKVYNYTTKEWINESIKIHNNKYDYSRTNYKNNREKVCIICPEHGEFWQIPGSHLRGRGCPICKNNKIQKIHMMDESVFLKKIMVIHRDKYDYSKVMYNGMNKKICIICPEHGEFWQTAGNHLSGRKCPKCCGKNWNYSDIVKYVENKFENISIPEFYYKSIKENFKCICCKHGVFEINLYRLKNNTHACPKCLKELPYYENQLKIFIEDNLKYKIKNNFRPDWLKNEFSLKKQELDIFIPELNIAIEYQGRHHFIDLYNDKIKFERTKILDKNKYNMCKEMGVKLYYFTQDKRNIPDSYYEIIYSDYNELLDVIKKDCGI